jgi:hypothetical protein
MGYEPEVRGTTSVFNFIVMRPADVVPIVISKNTRTPIHPYHLFKDQ